MKKITEENGFTIIEALVAMVILTVGILTLATMQIHSVYGNVTASSLTQASSVATDCYERLMNVGYGDAIMDAANNPHADAEFAAPALTLPPGVNAVNWSIVEWVPGDGDNDGDGQVDEPDEVGIKMVTLTVNYNDKAVGKTLTVNFFKHGLF